MDSFFESPEGLAAGMPCPDSADPAARVAELVAWLQGQGLMSILTPRGLGGLEASLEDTVQVVYEVGLRSGSAGLTYAMHLTQLAALAQYGHESETLTRAATDLSRSQGLIASVVSEVRTRGNIHESDAEIVRAGGRVVIRKQTSNTSYAAEAEVFLVAATDVVNGRAVQRLALARAADTRMEERFRHTLMGMHGIDNRAWSFTFELPEEALFTTPFSTMTGRTITPVTHIVWSACWSGIAASALEKAAEYLARECDATASETQHAALTLSKLRNKHYMLNALIREGMAAYAAGATAGVSLLSSGRMNRLKIATSELASEIALGTLQICGFRGYSEVGPYSVAEEIRDLLSAPLMVSNARIQSNTAQVDRYSEERP